MNSQRRRHHVLRLMMSRGFENTGDCRRYTAIAVELASELSLTVGRERVVARAPILGGSSPFSTDPTLHHHALERRVERAFLDAQDITRATGDRLGDFEPVQPWLLPQRLQHEEVERSLWNRFVRCHDIDILCYG